MTQFFNSLTPETDEERAALVMARQLSASMI